MVHAHTRTISSVSGSSPTSPAMLCNPSSPPLSAPAALAAATSIRSALGCMSPAAMCATRRETLLPLRARRRDAAWSRTGGRGGGHVCRLGWLAGWQVGWLAGG
eukprot:146481-Chlamydomonas_euryale.AAC.2